MAENKTTISNLVEGTYVFWLFNWGYRPVQSSLRLVPHYQKCEISRDALTISDETSKFVVPLDDIQSYDMPRYYEGSGAGFTSNLKLSLANDFRNASTKNGEHLKQIFIAPADVFDHYMDDKWELKNMYEVIRCYKSGEEPKIDKNPYHRMLLRRGKIERLTERTWDPNLHPSHYGTVPTVFSILKKLVLIVVIGTLIMCLVIGIIYYLVTTFFT